MADKAIGELTLVTTPTNDIQIPVEQSGTAKRMTLDKLRDFFVLKAVASFNGRIGIVVPQAKDYAAEQVSFKRVKSTLVSNNVREAIEELFTFVSNGKALIASAITDKGVDTNADASFSEMAQNIRDISSGGDIPSNVYRITLSAEPAEGGLVSGGGYSSNGFTCHAKAQEDLDRDYFFEYWEEDREPVSYDRNYDFIVEKRRSLIAKFIQMQYIAGVDWFKSGEVPLGVTSLGKMAYGNGVFVMAVTMNSVVRTIYSNNGIDWNLSNPFIQSEGSVTDIVFGDGKFVVSRYKYQVYQTTEYSYDGITWNKSNAIPWGSLANTYRSIQNLIYGDGTFVAIADNSKGVYYSKDAINWIATDPLPWGYGLNTAFGNGVFVTLPNTNTDSGANYSFDGIHWEKSSSADGTHMGSKGIAYGSGKFVAIAATNSANSSALIESLDGINWTASTGKLPIASNWTGIIYGNGKFVAVAPPLGKAAYSKDGINWEFSNEIPDGLTSFITVCFGDGIFVAHQTGSNNIKIIYSVSRN